MSNNNLAYPTVLGTNWQWRHRRVRVVDERRTLRSHLLMVRGRNQDYTLNLNDDELLKSLKYIPTGDVYEDFYISDQSNHYSSIPAADFASSTLYGAISNAISPSAIWRRCRDDDNGTKTLIWNKRRFGHNNRATILAEVNQCRYAISSSECPEIFGTKGGFHATDNEDDITVIYMVDPLAEVYDMNGKIPIRHVFK